MVTQLSSRVNSSEINGIASRAITAITTSGTDDSVVLNLKSKLESSNNSLTSAINRKSGSDATPLVQMLESNRDKGLKSFFRTVAASRHRLNEQVETAAKKLLEVIKRHGSTMYDLPQDQQTSAMASLFKELEAPDMVSAIELTGTTTILAEVKNANQIYLTELAKRSNDAAKEEEAPLVGENMKKVKVNLDKLMNYLDSYLAATDNEGLKTLYTELCDIIDKANAVIKARNTRKTNGEKEIPAEQEKKTA